jgi:hypothetical protein
MPTHPFIGVLKFIYHMLCAHVMYALQVKCYGCKHAFDINKLTKQ